MMKQRFFFTKPVRKAMRLKGLVTQRELAAAAGVTQPTISRLFSNRSCREDSMAKICSVLGLRINTIRDNTLDLKQADLPYDGKDRPDSVQFKYDPKKSGIQNADAALRLFDRRR